MRDFLQYAISSIWRLDRWVTKSLLESDANRQTQTDRRTHARTHKYVYTYIESAWHVLFFNQLHFALDWLLGMNWPKWIRNDMESTRVWRIIGLDQASTSSRPADIYEQTWIYLQNRSDRRVEIINNSDIYLLTCILKVKCFVFCCFFFRGLSIYRQSFNQLTATISQSYFYMVHLTMKIMTL